jgi:redox-sensitive bicupin YhaK (pirin superfamily)
MTAGTGVRHSEFNESKTGPVHFLQVWIEPARRGLPPGYEQRASPVAERRGRLTLIAAPDGADGACTIHQDARVYAAVLEPGEAVTHALGPGRHAWVHVARGAVTLDGTPMAHGDGAGLAEVPKLTIEAREPSEVLLFDLP